MPATTAYLDHAAFFVRDIAMHVAFFGEVLGMTVTQSAGAPEDPDQVWLLGGLQLIRNAAFAGPEGRFGHLGLICADVPAAIAAAIAHGATPTDRGAHWLELPDGLLLEFLPQKGEAVRIARSIDPRRSA